MEDKQEQSVLGDVDLEQLMNQYSLGQLQLKNLPYKQTSKVFRLLQGVIITDDSWNLLKLKQIKSVMFTVTELNKQSTDKRHLHILMVAAKSFTHLFLKSHFFHLIHLKNGEDMVVDACEVSVPLNQQITQAFGSKEVKLVEEFLDALSALIHSENGYSILIPSDLFNKLVLTENMKIKLDWHFFLRERPADQGSDMNSALETISYTRSQFHQEISYNNCSVYLTTYYNDKIHLECLAQKLLYQQWKSQQSQYFQFEDPTKNIFFTKLKEYILPLVSKEIELQEKIMHSHEHEELIRRYLFREQFCKHFIKNLQKVADEIQSQFNPSSSQTLDIKRMQAEAERYKSVQMILGNFSSQQMICSAETYQIYQKIVKVCKKSYYKLILKKAEQLFIQSPFYPQFFENVHSTIENRSNTIRSEKLRQLNLLYLQQHNQLYPCYPQAAEEIQQQYQNLLQTEFNASTGNIHEVEISLTESLRLIRLQKPVRFTSCRNHLSCLDQSAETLGISECPECKSPLSAFYNDEYLEFLCEIFQVNSIGDDEDSSSENAVQALNINTQTGLFIPVLRDTIFEDMMPAVMDAEFLYCIANRTYKQLDSVTHHDESDFQNHPENDHYYTINSLDASEQEQIIEEYAHPYQTRDSSSDDYDEEKNLTPTVPFNKDQQMQQHHKIISNDRANINQLIEQYDPFQMTIGKGQSSHEVYDEFSDFYYDNYPDDEYQANPTASQPHTENQYAQNEHKNINKLSNQHDSDITETQYYQNKTVSSFSSSSKPVENNQKNQRISPTAIFHSVYQIWKARDTDAKELRFSKYFNSEELMSEPSRSIYCKHTDCFDLSDLIRHNSLAAFSANAIKCPICSISFQFEHVVHDRYYSKLIKRCHPYQKMNLQNLHAKIDLLKQEITFHEATISINPINQKPNNSPLYDSYQEYLEIYINEEKQKYQEQKKQGYNKK